jgi:uncharacterized protein YndB with AHSA1/START domain
MSTGITAKQEIQVNAPVEKVWEALTDPAIIRKYFFGTNTHTDWKPGSPIIFEGEWQGKTYRDKGTIHEVEKNKTIRYDYWSSMSGIEDKPENYVMVTYSLREEGNGTILKVTQENVHDEKTKTHSEQNWKMVLEGLKKVVEG